MASIQPNTNPNKLSYRYPNLIENNGVSAFDFFYSATNKTFLFKGLGTPLTNVTIDFLKVDNMFVTNNNTLINP